MRLVIELPQVGPFAGPDQIVTAARRAAELGHDGLWVNDRVLWPTEPRAPFSEAVDGHLHPEWKRISMRSRHSRSPLCHTSRITRGTGILVLSLYDPILLARRLTTLDILSQGRPEDPLNIVEKIRAGGAVCHSNEFVTMPESTFEAPPIQQPRPPVLLAAYSPAGMARIASVLSIALAVAFFSPLIGAVTGVPCAGIVTPWVRPPANSPVANEGAVRPYEHGTSC